MHLPCGVDEVRLALGNYVTGPVCVCVCACVCVCERVRLGILCIHAVEP